MHIETTRPEPDPGLRRADRPPGRRALRAAVRHHRHLAAVRGRGAGAPHPGAEMDKGAGIAMCCTFGDLTDVQWWREPAPADAGRGRPRRADPARRPRVAADRRRPRAVRRRAWPGRRRSARARPWWPRCAPPATSTASRRPRSAWPTSSRRATSRSRSSPAASGTSATAAATTP
nr:hypothetical protein [Angustibacter aerolatus]